MVFSYMTFSVVLFDLDGTLLDSIQDIAGCANEVLGRWQLQQLSVEQFKAYVGDGVVNLARKLLPQNLRDDETVSRFLQEYAELYRQRWNASTSIYKGVPEMLTKLERRGVPMAVLSNKRDDFTKVCVRELLPSWRFAVVQGESASVPAKPDPSGALAIVQELNVEPARCLFVGDSEIDVETARRAGMGFVGVAWGFRSRKQLEEAGAQNIISSPSELLEFFGEKAP